MRSVHFPKLEEYAIEPVLIKEPSSYGNFTTTSTDPVSPSQAGESHQNVDHLVKSRKTAYFQRTSKPERSDKTDTYDGDPQTEPSVSTERADLEQPKNVDRYKRVRRQTAIERDESHATDDGVPKLPALYPGRASLVSNSLLGHQNLRHRGVPQWRVVKEALGETSTRANSIKFLQKRSPGAQVDTLRDQRQQADIFHKHVNLGDDLPGDEGESYISTASALRNAYKFRKGDHNYRVQSNFIDGSLWDYEVSDVPSKRIGGESTPLFSFHDVVAKSREGAFSLDRSNGLHLFGSRRSLWRVPLRKVLQKKDVSPSNTRSVCCKLYRTKCFDIM